MLSTSKSLYSVSQCFAHALQHDQKRGTDHTSHYTFFPMSFNASIGSMEAVYPKYKIVLKFYARINPEEQNVGGNAFAEEVSYRNAKRNLLHKRCILNNAKQANTFFVGTMTF